MTFLQELWHGFQLRSMEPPEPSQDRVPPRVWLVGCVIVAGVVLFGVEVLRYAAVEAVGVAVLGGL